MDKKKTTMSVPEMRRMLGLRKTDSYWLVHRQCFETVMVKGKMRIVIDSFEHWYANQVKYKKVDGPPPGEELRSYSYSPQELAEELGVCDSIVYDLIKRYDIETFEVDYFGCGFTRTFLQRGTRHNPGTAQRRTVTEMPS